MLAVAKNSKEFLGSPNQSTSNPVTYQGKLF